MKIRRLLVLVLSVLLLLGMSGCGASGNKAVSNEMAAGDRMEAGDDYLSKGETAELEEGPSNLPENRKLIQTVSMDVETEDLDAVLQQINQRIAQLGGYTESSNIRNGSAYRGKRYRSASLTIRIPAKDLDAFIDRVGEVSNIVSSGKTVEDVTLSYVATESRMLALQTEQTRLLELLAKAETMDDLLTVESRLTDVRTELEKVTSALKVFDNQVDYATVYMDIREVTEYTEVTEPETVWQRIGTGFVKSLKGVGNFFKELFVFVIVASPYLVLIGAAGTGVVFLVRLHRRKKERTQEKPKQDS